MTDMKWTDLWTRCGYKDWRTAGSGVIDEALELAVASHHGQHRRGGMSYIVHPLRVMNFIVMTLKVTDLSVLVASLLHDVVEDTSCDIHTIRRNFGDVVESIVSELTNDQSLPHKAKKVKMIEKSHYFSDKARIIKASDRIDNLLDLVRKRSDKRLAGYLPESSMLLLGLREVQDRESEIGGQAVVACDYLENVIKTAESILVKG